MSTCMGLVLVAGLVAMEDQALPSVATHTSLRQRLLEQQVSNDWHTEFNGAHAEARDLGLLLVIHFHAEWCDACERMQESVLNQPAMRERLGRSAVGVQLDVDGNPKLVSIFNVTALPTDVFVRADGCVLSQSTGGRSLESYLALVDGLAVEVAADATDGVKLGPEAWHQLAESEEGSSEFGDSKCVMRRENGEVIGMGGYSPVALARDRTWLQGRPELSARHEGIKYYFATEDELAAFQADPSRYAPQLLGCDPVVLTSQSRVLPGRIELGLFFKEQIYFFASDTSRSMFRTNPRRYVDSAGMVELDVADIETSM